MRRFPVVLVLMVFICCPPAVWAGGSGAYPNGSEDFMAGAVPPPGTYLLFYSNYYSADHYKDDHGDNYRAGPLADIDINVWANVIRVLHVTDFKILGANYAVQTLIPYLNMDFDFGAPFGFLSDTRSGLGDIIVDPIVLSWHGPKFHWVAGLDIYLPTGRYDKEKEPINPGNNVWTFEPVLAVSYLDGPIDLSLKVMYDFSTTNDDYLDTGTGRTVDLDPGQEFHCDFAAGYTFAGAWTAGLAGYYYQQTTDDEKDGVDVANEKGRVLALGPVIKYAHKNMSFTLKSLFETAVENRPAGNSTWFRFVYAF